MRSVEQRTFTAFEGQRRIASGGFREVAIASKMAVDRGDGLPLVVFDDDSGEILEIDYRGDAEAFRDRLPERSDPGSADVPETPAPRGPGRPRLGVVAREVTLLPRHWEWLNDQPGGASVALRKLVEEARRANEGKDRARKAREAAYRFLSAMGGDLPGFEEASRALFAGDRPRFDEQVDDWPVDVRDHARRLAQLAFEGGGGTRFAPVES